MFTYKYVYTVIYINETNILSFEIVSHKFLEKLFENIDKNLKVNYY